MFSVWLLKPNGVLVIELQTYAEQRREIGMRSFHFYELKHAFELALQMIFFKRMRKVSHFMDLLESFSHLSGPRGSGRWR